MGWIIIRCMKKCCVWLVLLMICFSCVALAGSVDAVQQRNAQLPDFARLHTRLADGATPMLWLFIGDSITHGCLHTHGQRSCAEHWMEIVKWEVRTPDGARRTNDLVLNAGVSGETATGFLAHADWRLLPFQPHVVFINFGINDGDKFGDTEKFRVDLTAIVRLVKEKNAIPVLQTNTLTLRAKDFRPHFSAVVREVADAEQTLLVDHAAAWEELVEHGAKDSASVPAPRRLMNNDLHPNGAGHLLMAQTIARSLRIVPAGSPTLNRQP